MGERSDILSISSGELTVLKKRHLASFSCFGWRGVRISGRTVPPINKLISPTGFGRCFFLTYRKHWLIEPMASWIIYPISFFHSSEMDSPSIYTKVGGVFFTVVIFFQTEASSQLVIHKTLGIS